MKKPETDSLKHIDLQKAIDCIPHSIAILDSKHRILALNRFLEAQVGYSADVVKGIYFDFVLRSNLGQRGKELETILETEEALSVEGDIINQQRKKIPVRFTFSPLNGYSSKQLGTIVFLEDISFIQNLDKKIHGKSTYEGIIGHSPQMQKIFELLPVIAQTDTTALITGETGTGKDLVAEAIHNNSNRAGQPFIKINCGALPESLLESELFGYARGAFTGADRDKPGMFRMANGGTIFLTEIGDLSLSLQVKLLTVLDDKAFYPLGSSKKVKVDVRVIAATHRDLRKLVGLKKFREDLYYRLNVLRLHLPPLRERERDIRLLIDYFMKEFSVSLKKDIKGFDKAALRLLLDYLYPGNVRELRNILEYAVTICKGENIEVEYLPDYILSAVSRPSAQAEGLEKNSNGQMTSDIVKGVISSGSESGGWGEVEKRMIVEALVETRGRRAQAAKILGWGRSTLWRKLKLHGLS